MLFLMNTIFRFSHHRSRIRRPQQIIGYLLGKCCLPHRLQPPASSAVHSSPANAAPPRSPSRGQTNLQSLLPHLHAPPSTRHLCLCSPRCGLHLLHLRRRNLHLHPCIRQPTPTRPPVLPSTSCPTSPAPMKSTSLPRYMHPTRSTQHHMQTRAKACITVHKRHFNLSATTPISPIPHT
jgi:hypothetical protein